MKPNPTSAGDPNGLTVNVSVLPVGLAGMNFFHVAAAVSSFGAPLMRADDGEVIPPRHTRVFGNIRYLYASSAAVFGRYARYQHDNRSAPCVAFVTDGVENLTSYGISVFPYATLNPYVLATLTEEALSGAYPVCVLPRPSTIVQELLAQSQGQTLYQEVHTLLYRVQDKELRAKHQASCILYLSGQAPLPDSVPGSVLAILESPKAKQLREVMAYVMVHGLDATLLAYPQADEYELAYLKARALKHIAASQAIKDGVPLPVKKGLKKALGRPPKAKTDYTI